MKIIKYIIGSILIAIVSVILYEFFLQDFVKNYKENFKNEPYVAILIYDKATGFEIPKDFNNGFDSKANEQNYFLSKRGEKILIKREDDFLKETKSIEKLKKLIHDKSCILIIANANSTLTYKNIEILIEENEKVPIIMPIANDIDIVKEANSANYNGFLQMLPDNKKQAETIQQFISHKFPPNPNVVIVEDEENNIYSSNLVREIVEVIRLNGGSVSKVSTNRFPEYSQLPNVIIYAGISYNASSLIDQLVLEKSSIPLILTDGCLEGNLYQQVSSKYTNGVFVLSPAILNNETNYICSYKPIGQDAYMLCKKIFSLSEANRSSVYDFIEKERNKKRNTERNDIDFDGDAGKYVFDYQGRNVGRPYKVYQINGGKLEEVGGFPD